MVPLLEWHLHFTQHSITTEGVDLRGTQVATLWLVYWLVPNILIGLNRCWRWGCPPGGWGGCDLGSHSPSGCAGVGGWHGCSGGTHPPPLRKVTSWSSTSGSTFPIGFPQGVCGGCLEVHSALRVQSPYRAPSWAVTTCYLQDPQGLLRGVAGYSHQGGGC